MVVEQGGVSEARGGAEGMGGGVQLAGGAPHGSVGRGERGLVAAVEEARPHLGRRPPGEALVVRLEDVARRLRSGDDDGGRGAEA